MSDISFSEITQGAFSQYVHIEKDVKSGKLQKLPLESLREINKLLGLDKQEEK